MDSDRRSTQVERLEVVDTGRRRRWTEDEKLKIVLESLQTPRQISNPIPRLAPVTTATRLARAMAPF